MTSMKHRKRMRSCFDSRRMKRAQFLSRIFNIVLPDKKFKTDARRQDCFVNLGGKSRPCNASVAALPKSDCD